MVHSQSAIAKSPKEEITVETLAPFPPAQLTKPAEVCAPLLLGHYLVCAEPNGKYTGGRIVETEAYGENDEANHAYNGKTPRNSPMFLPGGNTYVYRSYGIPLVFQHCNCKANIGEAVLIRAHRAPMGHPNHDATPQHPKYSQPCPWTGKSYASTWA